MRKTIIFGLVFVFYLALVIGDGAVMNVAVNNVVPSVLEVNISPDEDIKDGVQVNKTGEDRLVIINATIEDWNGIDSIDAVMANITGPSVIEESPITLVKIRDINGVNAIYNGNFTLGDGDDIGNYTITVNVTDGLGVSWTNVDVEYQEIGPPEIDVDFYDPVEDQEMPGIDYVLKADTTSSDIVMANFSINDVYWESSTPYCNTSGNFEQMCYNDTAGTDFSCLADFSRNYLYGRDTYVCLRAMLFDSEGDNGTDHVLIELDNMPPANITNLTAVPADSLGDIDLTWTWPGDNNMSGGAVSGYTMKVATSPILTEGDFNNAQDVQGTCGTLTPGSPGSLGSCTQTDEDLPGYVENSDTVYYFAIKTVDDVGQNSSISNSPGSVAPYHDITVDSIACVNAKNGYDCNDTTVENTNYLYDTLNVSGNISNNGNLNETVTAELKLVNDNFALLASKDLNISKDETELVSGLEWDATVASPDTELELSVEGFTSNSSKKRNKFKVWSIEDYVNLTWFNPNLYPAPTETAGQNFYVTVYVHNTNNLQHYWDIPLELKINTSFSISAVGPYDICVGDNKTCYMDVSLTSREYHYWYVNGLPAGTYNVTVVAGEHAGDDVNLTRIIEVVEAT